MSTLDTTYYHVTDWSAFAGGLLLGWSASHELSLAVLVAWESREPWSLVAPWLPELSAGLRPEPAPA